MTAEAILGFFLTLAMLAPLPTRATIEIVRDPKAWDFAPLLYSDLVVRGTVTSLSETEVLISDLWMDASELRSKLPPWKTKLVSVTLQVTEVLRGNILSGEQTFLVWDETSEAHSAYTVGAEMLICSYYHRVLKMYYQTTAYGRYARDGLNWRTEQTIRGQRTFTDADLRAKISSMELREVVSNAELIVEGVVESVKKTTVFGPDSSSAELTMITMRVGTTRKGAFADDAITVNALTGGLYLPAWATHVPQSFEPGQRWLCFLKRNEMGWYPFAGTNGLLRIEKNAYVYDERVPFWHSKGQVERAIAIEPHSH